MLALSRDELVGAILLSLPMRMDEGIGLSRDEPAIRYEKEKCGYICVMFVKHPPMIKLE